jgi:hypothetical protein
MGIDAAGRSVAVVANFFPGIVLAFLSSQGFFKVAALASAFANLRRDKAAKNTEWVWFCSVGLFLATLL